MKYIISFITKFGINFFTSPTFISYLSAIFLQYFDNISQETASFSGANGKSLCHSCNSSGYSRSASKKYPIGLFSLIDIIYQYFLTI